MSATAAPAPSPRTPAPRRCAGCWPPRPGSSADGPAQRRAAAAHRGDPGPGAHRLRQRRGDGPRQPRRPGSTSWCPASSRWPCMSTAFTGLAIGTGFERRYGVLKRLGASPLPRWGAARWPRAWRCWPIEVLQVAAARRGRARARAGTRTGRGWPSLRAGARRHRGVQRARPADGRAPCGPRRRWPPRTWSTCCSWSAAASPCRCDRFPDARPPGPRGAAGRRAVGGPARWCCATATRCPGGRSGSCSPGPRSRGVLAARTFRWE